MEMVAFLVVAVLITVLDIAKMVIVLRRSSKWLDPDPDLFKVKVQEL